MNSTQASNGCGMSFVASNRRFLPNPARLEGSLLILPGSGLVALGVFLGGRERRAVLYWTWAFILIAVGVDAMFALSAVGGIGGKSGHSMWWGVLILPYPVGWIMALVISISALIRRFKPMEQWARG
jgi:hypothetical protein